MVKDPSTDVKILPAPGGAATAQQSPVAGEAWKPNTITGSRASAPQEGDSPQPAALRYAKNPAEGHPTIVVVASSFAAVVKSNVEAFQVTSNPEKTPAVYVKDPVASGVPVVVKVIMYVPSANTGCANDAANSKAMIHIVCRIFQIPPRRV
jgi:hypothetical protein